VKTFLEPSQTKSKKRVADHGEVFTAEREVNAMLDLVKQETERIDSRFLEPACGEGNFLVEILRRKLAIVNSRYSRSPLEYEKYAVLAVSSIYGVELLPDNAEACRQRLFKIFDNVYTIHCKKYAHDECREAVRFILKRNILCGDALSLLDNEGDPLTFSEWTLVTGNKMQRRDFQLVLLMARPAPPPPLLLQTRDDGGVLDPFIPKPIRVFSPIHYRKVQQYNE
jgi:hypothetical protein